MIELTKQIEQAIAQIGDELGAEMIVKISVGAKKEIGGKTFGDYVLLSESQIEDGIWGTTLDWFKTKMKAFFDEAKSKEGG